MATSLPTTALRTPSIRPVGTTPTALADAVRDLTKWVQVRDGQFGDKLDAVLTRRDMFDAGVLSLADLRRLAGSTPGSATGAPVPDPATPPGTSDLIATPLAGAVVLQWNMPAFARLARFEVWRATIDSQPAAVLLASPVAQIYYDAGVSAGTTYYYWVRAVSQAGFVGPFNSPSGTPGAASASGLDITAVLTGLTGQLTASHLHTTLGTRIDLIDAPTTGLVTKVADLQTTYGSTASAATSASAAAAAQAAAVLAQAGAETAKAAAQGQATIAATKAAEAATSATSAASSATGAAGSAATSGTSATTAASAATSAGNSAAAAAGSATGAAASATAAGNSATASNSAKVAAESARDAASGSAGAAATSASSAATSATSAGTSASSASTSATQASTSAGNAGTSASSASTSATQASTSATNAAGSASSAASILSQVQSTTNGFAVSVAALQAAVDGVSGSYTVKIDNNGYVTGYGLASAPNNGTPTSSFLVRADQFAVASPSGPGIAPTAPFYVRTTPTTVNGITYNAGIFATSAMIDKLAVADAQIASLSANKIIAGYIAAAIAMNGAKVYGAELYSGGTTTTSYDANGSVVGFTANSPTLSISGGVARFNTSAFAISGPLGDVTPFSVVGNDVVVSGRLQVTSGSLGGITITGSTIESSNYNGVNAGFRLDAGLGKIFAYQGEFGGTLSAATGTFSGVLSAATGTFSGTLTASAIEAVDVINIKNSARTSISPFSTSLFSEAKTLVASHVHSGKVITAAMVTTGSRTSFSGSVEISGTLTTGSPQFVTVSAQLYYDGFFICEAQATVKTYQKDAANMGYSVALPLNGSVIPGAGTHNLTYTAQAYFFNTNSQSVTVTQSVMQSLAKMVYMENKI